MRYQHYQNQERCGGLLLPFIAGALVSAPIAYLAANNNTPEYVFPPQYQPYPIYTQHYQQPYPYQTMNQYPYQPINQPFFPPINQNPLQ